VNQYYFIAMIGKGYIFLINANTNIFEGIENEQNNLRDVSDISGLGVSNTLYAAMLLESDDCKNISSDANKYIGLQKLLKSAIKSTISDVPLYSGNSSESLNSILDNNIEMLDVDNYNLNISEFKNPMALSPSKCIFHIKLSGEIEGIEDNWGKVLKNLENFGDEVDQGMSINADQNIINQKKVKTLGQVSKYVKDQKLTALSVVDLESLENEDLSEELEAEVSEDGDATAVGQHFSTPVIDTYNQLSNFVISTLPEAIAKKSEETPEKESEEAPEKESEEAPEKESEEVLKKESEEALKKKFEQEAPKKEFKEAPIKESEEASIKESEKVPKKELEQEAPVNGASSKSFKTLELQLDNEVKSTKNVKGVEDTGAESEPDEGWTTTQIVMVLGIIILVLGIIIACSYFWYKKKKSTDE